MSAVLSFKLLVRKTQNFNSKEFLDPCLYDATFRSGRILKIKADLSESMKTRRLLQSDGQFIIMMGWCMVVFESLISLTVIAFSSSDFEYQKYTTVI